MKDRLMLISAALLCCLMLSSCGKESVLKEVTGAANAPEIDRSYAGVIPMLKEDGGWGALSADSEEIVPFTHGGLGGISRAGMMIFYDGDHHFIYDRNGRLMYEGDDDVSVAGDGYGVLELQDDGFRRLRHYTSSGDAVDEEEIYISAQAWSATPTDISGIRNYTVDEEGKLTRLPSGEEDMNAYSQVFYGDGAYESSIDGIGVWHYMGGAVIVRIMTEDGSVPDQPEVLGIYDAVTMSGERYWPVRKGDTWTYVDHLTGERPKGASEYEAAATFSGGYAVVVSKGHALVIGEDFKKLEDLGAATGARGYGDAWQITTEDGSRTYLKKTDH